jgi:cation diffusion facilitator CzcD-associated flavoprotein CzcO
MSDPTVVVIGAGPAGLAVAGELARRGVAALVLDQADAIGASWRGRYDRLRLNTCRLTSKLPRARYAKDTALFPTRDEVVQYLEDYATQNELDVRLRTRVARVDRSNGGWMVQTSPEELAARQRTTRTALSTPTKACRRRWSGLTTARRRSTFR